MPPRRAPQKEAKPKKSTKKKTKSESEGHLQAETVAEYEEAAAPRKEQENEDQRKKSDAAPAAAKRPKRTAIHLTEEQEEDLAEWLRTNEFIFNKKRANYKNANLKKQMWEDKAAELEVDSKQLVTWYESVRTKVGKLGQSKSGDPAKELSDRDSFILRVFGFLAEHIVKQPSRVAVSLKPEGYINQTSTDMQSSQEATHPGRSKSMSESHEEVQVQEDVGEESAIATTTTTSAAAASATTSAGDGGNTTYYRPILPDTDDEHDIPTITKGQKRPPPQSKQSTKRLKPHRSPIKTAGDADVLVQALQDQAEKGRNLQEKIQNLLEPSKLSPVALWTSWMGRMAENFHPDLMNDFYQETFNLMMRYKTVSDRRAQQQQQEQQKQQFFQYQPIVRVVPAADFNQPDLQQQQQQQSTDQQQQQQQQQQQSTDQQQQQQQQQSTDQQQQQQQQSTDQQQQQQQQQTTDQQQTTTEQQQSTDHHPSQERTEGREFTTYIFPPWNPSTTPTDARPKSTPSQNTSDASWDTVAPEAGRPTSTPLHLSDLNLSGFSFNKSQDLMDLDQSNQLK